MQVPDICMPDMIILQSCNNGLSRPRSFTIRLIALLGKLIPIPVFLLLTFNPPTTCYSDIVRGRVHPHFSIHHTLNHVLPTCQLYTCDTVRFSEVQFQIVPCHCSVFDTVEGVVLSIVCFVWTVPFVVVERLGLGYCQCLH